MCIAAPPEQQLLVEEVLGLELKAEQEAPSPQLVVAVLFQVELGVALRLKVELQL